MSDLQEVGSEICKIAELFNFQQGILDQTLTDLITDYNGIILTIPVRAHTISYYICTRYCHRD